MATRLTVVLVLVLAAGCGARAVSPSAPWPASASAPTVPAPAPTLAPAPALTLVSPLSEVTAWWGTRADSVWFVGKGGVAHFDGHGLRTAAVPGALRAIQGRSDAEVWLGGDAGLFRARLLDRQ